MHHSLAEMHCPDQATAANDPYSPPASAGVGAASPCGCRRELEDRIALLTLLVDSLMGHTGCPLPLPAPWRPQTMQAWLT
jgi:hypothetical protein